MVSTATYTWNTTGTANWNTGADWLANNATTGNVANGTANTAFINQGDVTLTSNQTIGTLNVDGGSLFLNNAGNQLTTTNLNLDGGGAINMNAAANLNASAFNVINGAYTQSDGNLTVTKNVNITGGTFDQGGGTITAGNINLTGGSFNGAGGTIALTRNLAISGGTFNQSAGTITVSNISLTGGNFNETGGSITLSNNLIVTGGTFNQDAGTITVCGASFSNSNATINGTFTDSGKLNVGGTKAHTTLNIGSGATATVEGLATVSNSNNGEVSTINMAGGTLTLNGGLTFNGKGNAGTISGFGTINGTGSINANSAGNGTITASGGTLTVAETVNSGVVLAISADSASTLNIAGTATSAAAITLNDSNQTLAVANSGNLTISVAETVAGGTINIQGGTINASGGLTVTSGALTGFGTVAGAISDSGSGAIEANGGVLDLQGAVGAATTLSIANSASSVLQIDGTVGAGDTVTFEGAAGAINYTNTSAGLNITISGEDIGTSNSVPTDFIDFAGANITLVGGNSFSGTSGTITLTDGTHTSTLTLSNLQGATGGTWYVDTISDGSGGTEVFLSNVVCFAAGTHILTPTGERQVESLVQGDLVLTLWDGELTAQPVKWLGRRRIELTAHPRPHTVTPVRIQRGAFADGMPHSDLLVSPDHAIFVDGKLIAARQLINGTTISQEQGWTSVEYFHIELDAHAVLLAEGLPAESYLDTGNRNFFGNSGAPMLLHPDLTDETDCPGRELASCTPFVWDEDSVRPVWQSLADRAAALGQPVPHHDTTDEPELRIVAKGRTVRPLFGEGGLYIFVLPKGTTEARIVSRANAPTDTRPWAEDRRRIGVYVERISLRGVDELRDIPLDHPDLKAGWWAIEHDGTAMRRWTDGDAVLSLPASQRATMLEVRASGAGMRYVVEADAGGWVEPASRKTVRR